MKEDNNYEGLTLASEPWSDEDIQNEAIVICYYDFRPDAKLLNKAGNPMKYLAAHTWHEKEDLEKRRYEKYIGTRKQNELEISLKEGYLYRKVLHRGKTGYCGMKEVEEKRKVKAVANDEYYDKNYGGMKGMMSPDENIDFEKVGKIRDEIKKRQSDKDNFKWMTKEELKDTEDGQIRIENHSKLRDFETFLREVLKGDTRLFWTAIVLVRNSDGKFLVLNGNTRKTITLNVESTKGIYYVEMTQEEYNSLNVKERKYLQNTLNDSPEDFRDNGGDEQIIAGLVEIAEIEGLDPNDSKKFTTSNKNSELNNFLVEKGINGNRKSHYIKKAKDRMISPDETFIRPGFELRTYTKDELLRMAEEYENTDLLPGKFKKAFMMSGGKFSNDDVCEWMGANAEELRNCMGIKLFVHFSSAKHLNDFKTSKDIQNSLKNFENLYLHGLFCDGLRSDDIEIEKLKWEKVKNNNNVFPILQAYDDAAD